MTKVRILALASACALAALPARAEKVGSVGAVNVAAHGTPPNAAKRPLSVGLGVEKREKIETSQDGTTQIIFNDTSTMTVGRGSAVVLDDFVYSGGGGSQGVSLAKGVMRFVGGGVSHEAGANLKTPTATIGVRGGSAMVRVGGDCGTLVVHQYGEIRVSGASGSGTLSRSGFGVCAHGGSVSEPFRVPKETIAKMLRDLESDAGQNGGSKKKPTNAAANQALGNDRPPSIETPPGLSALGPVWSGNALVQSAAGAANQPSPTHVASPSPTPPTPTPPPPPFHHHHHHHDHDHDHFDHDGHHMGDHDGRYASDHDDRHHGGDWDPR